MSLLKSTENLIRNLSINLLITMRTTTILTGPTVYAHQKDIHLEILNRDLFDSVSLFVIWPNFDNTGRR